MLLGKPWRTDALVRLFASVLICIVFIGALASSILHVMDTRGAVFTWRFLGAAAGGIGCFLAAVFVLRRQWPPEKFLQRLGWLGVFLYSGFLAIWLTGRFEGSLQAGLDGSTGRILVAVLSFQGMALVLVQGFLREHETGWAEAFGFRRGCARAAILGIVVAAVALPAGQSLQKLSIFLLEGMRISPHEQQAVEALRSAADSSSLGVLAVATIILVPVSEEVLFRGILYPSIKQAGFPRLALWCTSVLFGAIHGNLASFLPLTVFALALAWLYERTGNLLAPIFAHSIFNAVNFVMLMRATHALHF